MKRYSLYVFDLDGTLFRGNDPLPNAVETVRTLVQGGAKVAYVTNNSGATRSMLAEKLDAMGFPVQFEQCWGSADAAAAHCLSLGYRRVFVMGEPGLMQTLEFAGLSLVQDEPDVLVAGVCSGLSYDWIDRALQHLLAGVPFVATNTDSTYPLEGGRLRPGAGATIGALIGCSGVEPVVVGKPAPNLMDLVMQANGVGREDTLIVGDRLETDILAGQNAGCDTFLVMTGVTAEPPAGQVFGPNLSALL